MNTYQLANNNSAEMFEVSKMKEKSDRLQYKRGQIIYCEGSTPLGIYYVVDGKVKITKLGSDGKEQIVDISTKGELLDCSDMLMNSRYLTSTIALADSEILFMPRHELDELLNDIQIYAVLLMNLSRNLSSAHGKITDLAYKPVRGRLAAALVYLAKKFNECDEQRPCISLTRFDIACYIGTAKETVNRLMSEFRNEGMLETVGTKIYILNIDTLEKVGHMYD